MKTPSLLFLFICFLMLAGLNSASAGDAKLRTLGNAFPPIVFSDSTPTPTPTPQPSAGAGVAKLRTLDEIVAFITKDAKVSSLITLLGKPDTITEGDTITAYVWRFAIDDGSKYGTALGAIVYVMHGEKVIVGLKIGTIGKSYSFPWCPER